jgi:rhodanese-related sulfurtransferase
VLPEGFVRQLNPLGRSVFAVIGEPPVWSRAAHPLGRAWSRFRANAVRDGDPAADQRARSGALRVLIPQLAPSEVARWRADAARAAPLLSTCASRGVVELCRIDGAVVIPLGDIESPRGRASRDRPLVMVCHHGGRSQHAATLLAGAGFTQVHNMRACIDAWAVEVDRR